RRANFFNHTPGGVFSIWAKTFQPDGGGIFQDVSSITANTPYTFSSFLYFEAGFTTITDPVTAQVGLAWLDAGGNPVGSPTFLNIAPADNPPIGTWTQYTLNNINAPTG